MYQSLFLSSRFRKYNKQQRLGDDVADVVIFSKGTLLLASFLTYNDVGDVVSQALSLAH